MVFQLVVLFACFPHGPHQSFCVAQMVSLVKPTCCKEYLRPAMARKENTIRGGYAVTLSLIISLAAMALVLACQRKPHSSLLFNSTL